MWRVREAYDGDDEDESDDEDEEGEDESEIAWEDGEEDESESEEDDEAEGAPVYPALPLSPAEPPMFLDIAGLQIFDGHALVDAATFGVDADPDLDAQHDTGAGIEGLAISSSNEHSSPMAIARLLN